MSAYAPDKAATVVPFAPTPKGQQPEVVADESGRTIIALLQKAADMAKEDCARAMDLAHKLSFCERPRNECESSRPKRATFATVRPAPRPGCCASTTRWSRYFLQRR